MNIIIYSALPLSHLYAIQCINVKTDGMSVLHLASFILHAESREVRSAPRAGERSQRLHPPLADCVSCPDCSYRQ